MKLLLNGQYVQQLSSDRDQIVVTATGKLLRTAEIKDEEWLSEDEYGDPQEVIAMLKQAGVRVDTFTFSQKLPDEKPKYALNSEWDNVAAINTADFDNWWTGLPQEARKNARLSVKRGVTVRPFALDDQSISGIMEIYNETPVRQGRPFSHYGKDHATVKREISTLLSTSEFIGAYHGDELIGFIKLVYIGRIGSILHIVSKNRHFDKKPTNALITKAAEVCRDRGLLFLTYGKYTYGNKTNSLLTEFKHRTGFKKILVPRYYVPLTFAGKIYLKMQLHRRLIDVLPPGAVSFLLGIRGKLVNNIWRPLRARKQSTTRTVPDRTG